MTAVTFKNLRATNALTYKELEVPLDNQGLVLLTAKNNDSTGSNGSGKSNIWEILCHLIFGTTGKGLNKKGIVNQFVGKDMLIELDLEVDGTPYLFRETRNHSEYGTGSMVFESGNDVTPKNASGKNRSQMLMQEITGFSLQEYLGLVYLCQKYNHVLVKGTRSEKQAYLSALFGLDKYEVLYKEAKTRTKDVDQQMAGFQSYERDLERCSDALKLLPAAQTLQTNLDRSSTALDAKKTQRETLTQEVTQLRAAIQQEKRRTDAIAGLEALSFLVISEEDLQEKRTLVESNLTLARQTTTSLEMLIEKLKHKETVKSQIPAAPELSKEELHDTTVTLRVDIQTHQVLIQQISQRIAMEAQLKELKTQREQYPSLVELNSALNEAQEEYKTLAAQLKEADFNLRAALEAKKSLDAITGSVCPTCLRGISPTEKDTLTVGLCLPEKEAVYQDEKQKSVQAATKETTLRQQQAEVERLTRDGSNILKNYVHLPLDNMEDVKGLLQHSSLALQTAEASLNIWSTIETLNTQLENLPDGDISMNEVVLNDLVTQKATYKNELDVLNKAAVWIRDANLATEGITVGDELLNEKQTDLRDLSEKIDTLIEQKTILVAQRKERKSLEDAQSTAQTMLHTADDLRPRQVYLPKLVDAFGPKGLKTIRLDLIMQQLVKLLPNYLGPMFAGSGYKVSVGSNLDFELAMMHEGNRVVLPGKGTSGGESKALDMATLFALRTLRTSHKSANILIVDEPYGDLDAGKREVLTDLFQQLRTTEAVSSVFVITHEAEVLQHSFDKVWTVVRQNNESILQV